jgi:cysteine sulfinate desulfinase/cysteine desulfurase-like protein
MGATESEATSSLRISLGWATKPEDIDSFLAAWRDLYRNFTRKSA